MLNYLTLDSSVIITALRKEEEMHEQCKKILEEVVNGKYIALEPYTVLVEVTAAIKRRTGSEILAEKVKKDLQEIDTIYFFDLIKQRADKAADIAKKTGIRGMDAIVVQTAEENNSILLSLDNEMLEKVKSLPKIKVGQIKEIGKI